jgi:putative addiction module component (TIGR02574 family)
MDKAALLNAMDAWTIDERLEFIDAIHDRLLASGWTPLEPDPEVLAEIERRRAEHEKDPSSALSWDEVQARLRARM